jgi:hypothetical protein
MLCAICQTRRPRRYCPGVRGDICAICCGTEREVTVECPFECEYLQEGRKHERPQPIDPEAVPNKDIEINEELLASHEALLSHLTTAMVGAALAQPGVSDYDVRDALDALTRTYRTLLSGVYYETRPQNAFADGIYQATRDAAEEFRREEQRNLGMTRTRDRDVLALLVFLQRIELDRNNGRRKGRAFLDAMRRFAPDHPETAATPRSSLILP